MKKILCVFVAISLLTSCIRSYTPVTGDLVFQDLDCGELCNAIEKVTSGIDGADFSHVGIISVEEGSAFVYEAIGTGVTKTPFQKFLNRSKDTLLKPKIFVGRLKVGDQNTISGAVNFLQVLFWENLTTMYLTYKMKAIIARNWFMKPSGIKTEILCLN
ncbi:MAG: hypothetical protein HC905_23500 [Bacteroidales bacterium]|nr:hypothetical protein [Bacteroidales bacterium]